MMGNTENVERDDGELGGWEGGQIKFLWLQYDPTVKESAAMFYSRLCFIVCGYSFLTRSSKTQAV